MADNHRKLPTKFFDRIMMLLERRASGVTALDDIIDVILADPDYAEPNPVLRSITGASPYQRVITA